jgi:CDP-6-deoxy-D-xylo-4-hexulose-3-dehydrase
MIKKYPRVPYGLSVHGIDEIKAINNVLKKSTQMGTNVSTFEKKIAKLFDKKYGLMVNSGSSALMLAMEVLNLPEGSEIITPILTFSSTISYITKNRLIPVFIDVKKNTYCIDEENIAKHITKKTKAILAPNLIGNIANWKKIYTLCKKHGLYIIEDSADALGAKLHNKSTGSYTDISITSFYGSHIINCAGNGGMVCFNNEKLYKKAKLLRSWGRSSSLFDENSEKIENRFNIKLGNIFYDKKFVFEEIGHNLEPSELGAAFGLVQLKKLNKNINKRIKIFNQIFNFLEKYNKYFELPIRQQYSKSGWLAFPFKYKSRKKFIRKDLQIFLEKRNIQTRVVFTGNITKQPGFRNIQMKKVQKIYKEADDVMQNGILVGCHHGMTDKMVKHLMKSIEEFIKIYEESK